MKFVSYAQNFEDVILKRAFEGQEGGFYIDVGAADPVIHSVTRHFYGCGWSGINIEPGSRFFRLLQEDRPRDINLNFGLSDTSGEATFYEAPSSLGLSTFNASWTDYWEKVDGVEFVERSVPVMTLAEVCERHVDRPIDFLKIDVEGREEAVILGGDFSRWRPRVVLAEGDRSKYQARLVESGYLHAAFDGVNHYFVREEDRSLIAKLSQPVSLVRDNFELHEYLDQIGGLVRLLEIERADHEATRSRLSEASDVHASILGLLSRTAAA